MKKILLVAFLCFNLIGASQIFKAKQGSTLITFYSKAALENIEAVNKGAVIVLNTTSNEIQVWVTVQNFKFKNALMEDHFNESYLESDKFPNCVFKGKINEVVDYAIDGEHKITTSGKITLHGIMNDITLDGMLVKKGNEIILDTRFDLKLVDFDIQIPSIYSKNIAESIEITLNSTLEPFIKK